MRESQVWLVSYHRVARLDSMVSVSELLVKLRNVVNECKILIHSAQNGMRSVNPLHGRITRIQAPPEDETEPNLSVSYLCGTG